MSTPKKQNPIDFEKSIERLNELIEKMERGDLPLEKSLQYFEEGIELIRYCQKALTEAEQKVEVLMQEKDKDVLSPYSPDQATTDSQDV